MTNELSNFAARLREIILSEGRVPRGSDSELRTPNSELRNRDGGSYNSPLRDFISLALELFALQFKYNAAYRKICEARGFTPKVIEHWTQIPAVPTATFKELELTCLAPTERTAVFHSSGTVEQKPSRHFHNAESLAVYEASLWSWFQANVAIGAPSTVSANFQAGIVRADSEIGAPLAKQFQFVILTPPPLLAPHSSLVHMFETVRQKLGGTESAYFGKIATDGSWTLDFDALLGMLNSSLATRHSSLVLGTAFSFVHLLDFLAERNLRFDLPAGSRVMETGGYKNRSRSMPKTELHQLITERLGVPPSHIICEYGMSELSSQAYDGVVGRAGSPLHAERRGGDTAPYLRVFQFPPWARVQVVSPETGREVANGETGLIRVFDLANVFSVMAVQTEDLGIRRGEGFELIGRAALAEPRGCSLMSQSAIRNPQSAIP
ncbi:MAG: hypothetical protein ABSG80_10470 [Verrucomicrobiota bacterium]